MSITNERKQIAVEFDTSIFHPIVIKKAAYKYLASFACDITIRGNSVVCLLSFPSSSSDATCAQLVDDFKKEVLDQDLRERLRAETEAVRNLILAHAFSKTGIVNRE